MSVSIVDFLEDKKFDEQPEPDKKKHWATKRDDNDILWCYLDRENRSSNTIGREVLQELDDLLSQAEQKLPSGLVICSSKKAGFCAGADIEEFKDLSEEQLKDMLRDGHEVLDRLDAFPVTTIALLHGHCLGGGLELALACDIRIGVKGGLEVGFPEIQLGVHPGLGGTYRLTSLIDPVSAMTMMLTGKPLRDKQALKQGVVDELVEARHTKNAVLAATKGKLHHQKQSIKHMVAKSAAARRLIAKKMRQKAEEKAPSEHYPAPNALIDLWVECGSNAKKMQKKEIESFAQLLQSETAQNLIRVFFLSQKLKGLGKGETDFRHVHVIGAGTMGADIAAWCAMRGFRVTLFDKEQEELGKAVTAAEKMCRGAHRSSLETRDTLDRLIPDLNNEGVKRADLIIEAVPEEIDIKSKVYSEVESVMRKDAILATNTSSIPLDQLAEKLSRPSHFIGLHFFNPVAKMKVVEVVSQSKTSKKTKSQVLQFAGAIKKFPVPVKTYPGFLVNRVLTPYLLEAIQLVDEGMSKEQVDQAAIRFGMPMGPLELSDQVGLDICLHVADMLAEGLSRSVASVPDWLRQKVEDGQLGKKTGEGLYKWKQGKPQKNDEAETTDDTAVTDRLVLPMLNACIECHDEGVIEDYDLIDGAMIFATGFAPFRGGPIHYARHRGAKDITETLQKFEQKHGERFQPEKGWEAL